MSDEMRIWERVCKTDPKHTKHVGQRGGFTAIDAQYQVQTATEVFGPVGVGWGYECLHGIEVVGEVALAVTNLTLWYMDGGEKRSYGPVRACNQLVGAKGRVDEDAWKKALTDALTKALSHLGFNADVFLGKFDDNRYVQRMEQEFAARDNALVNQYLDSVRQAVADNDELGGLQLIAELRKEDDSAWVTMWSMLDTKEKKVVRAWGKPGEKAA